MQILTRAGARARSLASKAGVRRALMVGGSLAGTVVVAGALSVPAGAAGLKNPANTTIIGSGSATTYNMMQSMDLLFNQSPGCQQFVEFPAAPKGQPLDYSCTGPQTINPGTLPGGESGPGAENPYNDISVEEPQIGSSSGVQQLECQGAHGSACSNGGANVNVANNQSFARQLAGIEVDGPQRPQLHGLRAGRRDLVQLHQRQRCRHSLGQRSTT